MEVKPHSLDEARYINEMTMTRGWPIFQSYIEQRIDGAMKRLLDAELESYDDALKVKGLIQEIKALKGLLLYVSERQKKANKEE